MKGFFLIALGGAAGALSRYWISGLAQSWFRNTTFPFGTLTVNLAGSFAIGFLSYLANERGLLTPEMRLAFFIGFLGAFTTFSTFANETVTLMRTGEYWAAFIDVAAHDVLGLAMVWTGYTAARLIWR